MFGEVNLSILYYVHSRRKAQGAVSSQASQRSVPVFSLDAKAPHRCLAWSNSHLRFACLAAFKPTTIPKYPSIYPQSFKFQNAMKNPIEYGKTVRCKYR